MFIEKPRQNFRSVQMDAEGRGTFRPLHSTQGNGYQCKVFQHEKRGMAVLYNDPQLVKDQIRFEFQCGS